MSLASRSTPMILDASCINSAGLSLGTVGMPVTSRQSLRAYCSSSSNLTDKLQSSLPRRVVYILLDICWI